MSSINLNLGWNLISTSYKELPINEFNIVFYDNNGAMIKNNFIFWEYKDGSYKEASILHANQGYWLRVNIDCTLIIENVMLFNEYIIRQPTIMEDAVMKSNNVTIEESDIYTQFTRDNREYIIVLDYQKYVKIIDITTSNNPKEINKIKLSGTPFELYYKNDNIYILLNYIDNGSSSGIQVFNVNSFINKKIISEEIPIEYIKNSRIIQSRYKDFEIGDDYIYLGVNYYQNRESYVALVVYQVNSKSIKLLEYPSNQINYLSYGRDIQATTDTFIIFGYSYQKAVTTLLIFDIRDNNGKFKLMELNIKGRIKDKTNIYIDDNNKNIWIFYEKLDRNVDNPIVISKYDINNITNKPLIHYFGELNDGLKGTTYLNLKDKLVAFAVTFLTKDPIYSFNLSEDKNWEKDELKNYYIIENGKEKLVPITGFSSFLKPIKNGKYLIGIGQDDKDNRTVSVILLGVNNELKLSFLGRVNATDTYSYSDATYDERASTIIEYDNGVNIFLPYNTYSPYYQNFVNVININFSKSILMEKKYDMYHIGSVLRTKEKISSDDIWNISNEYLTLYQNNNLLGQHLLTSPMIEKMFTTKYTKDVLYFEKNKFIKIINNEYTTVMKYTLKNLDDDSLDIIYLNDIDNILYIFEDNLIFISDNTQLNTKNTHMTTFRFFKINNSKITKSNTIELLGTFRNLFYPMYKIAMDYIFPPNNDNNIIFKIGNFVLFRLYNKGFIWYSINLINYEIDKYDSLSNVTQWNTDSQNNMLFLIGDKNINDKKLYIVYQIYIFNKNIKIASGYINDDGKLLGIPINYKDKNYIIMANNNFNYYNYNSSSLKLYEIEKLIGNRNKIILINEWKATNVGLIPIKEDIKTINYNFIGNYNNFIVLSIKNNIYFFNVLVDKEINYKNYLIERNYNLYLVDKYLIIFNNDENKKYKYVINIYDITIREIVKHTYSNTNLLEIDPFIDNKIIYLYFKDGDKKEIFI